MKKLVLFSFFIGWFIFIVAFPLLANARLIFQDDFENGFNPWDGSYACQGCLIEISNTQKYLGNYSSHFANHIDEKGSVYLYKAIPTQNIMFFRFYFYLEEDSDSSYAFLGGFTHYIPTPNPGIGINGAERNLFLRYEDASGSHYLSSSVALAPKRWHSFQMMVNKTAGEIKIWLDGEEVTDLTRTGLNLAGQTYDHIFIGISDAYRYAKGYFDAIVVADTHIESLPETIKNATLNGTVTNIRTKEPVANAVVNITNIYTKKNFITFTNSNGVYSIKVPLYTYDVQVIAQGYEPVDTVRIEASEETNYTTNFQLLPVTPLVEYINTDFSSGTLNPYTSAWNEGIFQFFTPQTDPLGSGKYGVIFKNGRIAGNYDFTSKPPNAGLGIVRINQIVAFPNTTALNGFLTLRTKQMLGTGNYIIWLDVWNNKWRTIYYNNNEMVYGDYPSISPPQPNRKYNVTLELKMGSGNGEIKLYIDNTLVWEKTKLNNIGAGATIDVLEIGLSVYGTGAITYFYSSKVEGAIKPVYTLSGYVKNLEGNPLKDTVIAIGVGEVNLSRPDKGVIHTPIKTLRSDATGFYTTQLTEGTYMIEAFKGPGKYGEWLTNAQGRVIDYAEKIKEEILVYSNVSKNFTLRQTLAPQPSSINKDYYWDERSIWIFPFTWGGYSLRDGTATLKQGVIEALNDLEEQIPNINTIDVRLAIATHPDNPNIPILYSGDAHPVTMEDIEAITKEAHARGFRVHLAMVPYGGIDPALEPSQWFQNYQKLLLNPTQEQRAVGQTEGVIQMAKRLGIEEFTLGWEYWGERREFEEGEWVNYWVDLIDAIRASGYTGKLAYHFQTINDPDGNWGPPIDKFLNLQGPLMEKLDFIAISDFHISEFIPYDVDCSYEESFASWYQHPDFAQGWGAIKIYSQIYEKFKIPIVVNFGYRLRWGSCITYGVPDLPKDEHTQALLYKSAFDALSNKSWLHGVNLEHFDTPYSIGNPTGCVRGEYSTKVINQSLASHLSWSTISGQLKDVNNNILQGEIIVLREGTNKRILINSTDSKGKYYLSVPTKKYDIEFNLLNFQIPDYFIKLKSIDLKYDLYEGIKSLSYDPNKISILFNITSPTQTVAVYSSKKPSVIIKNFTVLKEVTSLSQLTTNTWFYNFTEKTLYINFTTSVN
jgi:hypothetical protein